MKIDIQYHQLKLDKTIESYINRKLKFALSRVEKSISSISISFTQKSIKSELIEVTKVTVKKCHLKVTYYNLQILEFEDTQTDIY